MFGEPVGPDDPLWVQYLHVLWCGFILAAFAGVAYLLGSTVGPIVCWCSPGESWCGSGPLTPDAKAGQAMIGGFAVFGLLYLVLFHLLQSVSQTLRPGSSGGIVLGHGPQSSRIPRLADGC